jgi:uncharacterized protein (DUF362 family)
MRTRPIDRRTFIQQTALAAGALSVAGTVPAGSAKSAVVEVHRPGVVRQDGRPGIEAVREMLDRGMRELTGEPLRRDQWRRFVSDTDTVGLKVNGLGGPLISTKHELVRAVIEALKEAGVKPGNIVVFDRYSEHLKAVVLNSRLEDLGVAVLSCEDPEGGFDAESTRFASGSTHLARILTGRITALINMPIVKDHVLSGTTVSLKNYSHGLTDKPWEFHNNHCDPYIAHVNALEAVSGKHRLVVADALSGCCDGGPDYKPNGIVRYDSLFLSTDRVALDSVGTERIEAARREKGFPTLAQAGRPAKYLATAEALGLGNRDPGRIDHRIVE